MSTFQILWVTKHLNSAVQVSSFTTHHFSIESQRSYQIRLRYTYRTNLSAFSFWCASKWNGGTWALHTIHNKPQCRVLPALEKKSIRRCFSIKAEHPSHFWSLICWSNQICWNIAGFSQIATDFPKRQLQKLGSFIICPNSASNFKARSTFRFQCSHVSWASHFCTRRLTCMHTVWSRQKQNKVE